MMREPTRLADCAMQWEKSPTAGERHGESNRQLRWRRWRLRSARRWATCIATRGGGAAFPGQAAPMKGGRRRGGETETVGNGTAGWWGDCGLAGTSRHMGHAVGAGLTAGLPARARHTLPGATSAA